MNFLWIRATLDLANGGPIAAVGQLTTALKNLGHSSEVVTLDARHAPGVAEFPGVVHALGPSWGKYGYNTRLVPWLCQNAARFDAVIVSGIWQYPSFGTWLAARKVHFPYFVFTHGMLDPWFKLKYPLKHLKKWFYWPWAEYRVLRDATAVFFTSVEEKKLAPQSFWLYQANEIVVNYGIGSPPENGAVQRQMFLNRFPDLQKKRLILFLSRIDPKKGCDLLIGAFAQVANQDPDLHLVIAGPDQEGWQTQLMEQATRLGLDGRITWTGMLTGDIKWGAYRAAEVFLLPSHSENFGVVVAEALACRLPVLITNKINIWQEIENDGAGIIETDTQDGILRLLQKWLRLSPDEQQKMGENARDCFMRRFNLAQTAQKFVDVIEASMKN
jgi:glycosyltransferase involved in cell wall biosynthesis